MEEQSGGPGGNGRVERGGRGKESGEGAWGIKKKKKQVLGVRHGWRGREVAGRRPRAWKARRVPTAAERGGAVARQVSPGMLPRGAATVSSSWPCTGGQWYGGSGHVVDGGH